MNDVAINYGADSDCDACGNIDDEVIDDDDVNEGKRCSCSTA